MKKQPLLSLSLGALLFIAGYAIAQPAKNVSPARHPNIAAAQNLSQRAYERIIDAQKANEWDMAGHAQKAKNLLEEVNRELREAATAANRNR
jgi:F0F1-type ATP synthase membrane subunit b/b'